MDDDRRGWSAPRPRPAAWPKAILLSLAAVTIAHAAEREQGPHVHGVGRLNVAIEGRAIAIELMAPGADIVGFEHAAESATDKAAVAAAVAKLMNGAALFGFPAQAGCKLDTVEIESTFTAADHHDKDGSDHKEHEADGRDANDEREHAEFHALYQYSCSQIERLSHIDIKLFQLFPTARELQVQTVSSTGQAARTITPGSARLTF